MKNKLNKHWSELFSEEKEILNKLYNLIEKKKNEINYKDNKYWYQNSVVYCLYVDLFNSNFEGLESKLEYLNELGVNCIWLLPILGSPMKDAGFDIDDYSVIRSDLFEDQNKSASKEHLNIFKKFIDRAHDFGIRIIFDVGINHTSDEHKWFKESKSSVESKYHDYYIWEKDDKKYSDARIIFKGMCNSNWEYNEKLDKYFFHRFFEFQPDLNYKNPEVLYEIISILLDYKLMGIDGFRLDAVPYLWKEENTDCENLSKTHTIIKIMRLALDMVSEGTLLLAEANQEPKELVKYFGDGDECHAAFNFPLSNQIYISLAAKDKSPVAKVYSKDVTPVIPDNCEWFSFLRLHDELSLEKVSEEDRKFTHSNYCKKPEWDFRMGEGIASRLAELFDCSTDRILLSFAVLFSLPGIPVIFYGDEFGKKNDYDFFDEMYQLSGKKDTRYYARGKINWNEVEKQLQSNDSYESKIFNEIKKMIKLKKELLPLSTGDLEYIELPDNTNSEKLLVVKRTFKSDSVHIIINLSDQDLSFKFLEEKNLSSKDLMGKTIQREDEKIVLKSFSYYFI